MALAAPITINDQLCQIRDWLTIYAAPLGGSVAIVSNLLDLWNQSSQNSQFPTIYVMYNGESSRGSFGDIAPWHRVDRQWIVRVKRGRGYFSQRGDSLANSSGTETPFVAIVEQVRDKLRCMLGISEELPTIDYKSIKPVRLGDLVMDCFDIEFSTANDVPAIGTTPSPAIN